VVQEEAEAVTGHSDAEQAANSILDRPGAQTQWCVVKLGPLGALIRTKNPPQTLHQSALQVSPTSFHFSASRCSHRRRACSAVVDYFLM
jgi:sugar/nucleoside kinase (ribokinase family)